MHHLGKVAAEKSAREFESLILRKNMPEQNRLISNYKPEKDIGRFETVEGNPELLDITKKVFDQTIKPLYGDQTFATNLIEKATDRTTKILFEGKVPAGIFVLKNKPTSKFKKDGFDNVIEIKTLFVIEPNQRSRQGVGTQLLNEVMRLAKKTTANYLTVSISAKKNESLSFFQKHGFRIVKSTFEEFVKGDTEHLLVKQID